MKISELMDDIYSRNLVLPEFQREYVWTKEQAKQLLVSLFKEYPVGGLLFWKTTEPPELKNVDVLPDMLGNIAVILDGQQRLTTLYMLTRGEIPPYYIEQDISNDPRELYFNLDDCDFQYYQHTRMRGNPLWLSVVECFTNPNLKVFHIARQVKQQRGEGVEADDLAERFLDNLTRLRQIREISLPAQIVPTHASIDEAVDIFDRVNSQGTKLTDAELALTHVTAKWPQARRALKGKIDELSRKNFYFDLTFMTRALTGVVTKRALFEHIHAKEKEEVLPGWKQLGDILDYLVSILPSYAKIHSTEDINTTNALVPLVVYLAMHDNHFPTDTILRQAIHWLYAALMWSRYTAQTDQRLERDISLVVQHDNPWSLLEEQVIDQRGRIDVKASDLEGRGTQHPLYRMTYVIAKQQGAVDWFNGVPLGTTHGRQYRLNSHHIFPQSLLYGTKYDADNHLHRKLVNSIANRAFLTADSNLSLGDIAPEMYLPEIEKKYPGALTHQFIPIDPDLWHVERYEDFLAVRHDLIAKKINEFMDSLVTEPEIMHEKPITELIDLGESVTLEFKSTLQWDVLQGQLNKQLRKATLKTVAAFMNSEGGTLVIGVEDSGNILGLSKDLKLVKGQSLDGFEQTLATLIGEYIGHEYARLIHIRFERINEEYICAINVDRAAEPIFVKGDHGKEFYIRVGNTTRLLDVEEMHRYVITNWE